MTFIATFRIVVLSLSLFLSVVILGLGAYYTQGSTRRALNFEIVAFLAWCLSILTLPVFLFLAATQKGAFTSKIVVELPCLFILCALWIITSALTMTWSNALFPSGCSGLLPDASTWCHQVLVIKCLSFLAWISLLTYTVTLFTCALIAHIRGNRVWCMGVNEATFFAADQPDENPTKLNSSVMVQRFTM